MNRNALIYGLTVMVESFKESSEMNLAALANEGIDGETLSSAKNHLDFINGCVNLQELLEYDDGGSFDGLKPYLKFIKDNTTPKLFRKDLEDVINDCPDFNAEEKVEVVNEIIKLVFE